MIANPRPEPQPQSAPPALSGGRKPWLRRLGLAGFLFFLVKGLLWIAVPIAVAVWRAVAS